jgi:hypothetical protein
MRVTAQIAPFGRSTDGYAGDHVGVQIDSSLFVLSRALGR